MLLQRVPVDGANRAEIGTNPGGNARWKRYLRKPLQHFLAIPVVIGIVIEDQVHNRQPCQRHRPQVHEVRNSVHLDFDGYRDLLLDFFCGAPGHWVMTCTQVFATSG